jgi:hypothetical protein
LQLKSTRSNGSARASCVTIGGNGKWKSPIGLSNRQAMPCELRGPARPKKKGDFAAGLQQPSAEVASDRARSDNENSHFADPPS